MKRAAQSLGLGALLLVIGSCSTTYISDWDTQREFSGYRSFAWFEFAQRPSNGRPPTPGNQIVADRIRRSVTSEIESKGFEVLPVGEADLMVSYFVVLQSRMVLHHTGWGFAGPYSGWGWGWGGGWGSTYGRTLTEGTLVVDVLDASSRKLVWRGMAQAAFSRPNPSDERVAKVVAKTLRRFPPG